MTVICDYCQSPAQYVHSEVVYGPGRDYGMLYFCKPCEAWVGCHKGTDKPKGRLANKELREWKIKAHAAFDPLWQKKYRQRLAGKPGKSGHPGGKDYRPQYARNSGYKWLAGELGLTREECHIGMMDVEMCKRVIAVCSPYNK